MGENRVLCCWGLVDCVVWGLGRLWLALDEERALRPSGFVNDGAKGVKRSGFAVNEERPAWCAEGRGMGALHSELCVGEAWMVKCSGLIVYEARLPRRSGRVTDIGGETPACLCYLTVFLKGRGLSDVHQVCEVWCVVMCCSHF